MEGWKWGRINAPLFLKQPSTDDRWKLDDICPSFLAPWGCSANSLRSLKESSPVRGWKGGGFGMGFWESWVLVREVGIGIYWTDLVEEYKVFWLFNKRTPGPPRLLATGRHTTWEMWLDVVAISLRERDMIQAIFHKHSSLTGGWIAEGRTLMLED